MRKIFHGIKVDCFNMGDFAEKKKGNKNRF